MIAFGTSDGCVAVRNLQTKSTLTRYMGVLISEFGAVKSTISSSSIINPLVILDPTLEFSTANNNSVSMGVSKSAVNGAAVDHSGFIKKVEFLPGAAGSACRLLVLYGSGVAVWEPKHVRFVPYLLIWS